MSARPATLPRRIGCALILCAAVAGGPAAAAPVPSIQERVAQIQQLVKAGRHQPALRGLTELLANPEITTNPALAGMVFASRAEVHLKLRDPESAVRDFDSAAEAFTNAKQPIRVIAVLGHISDAEESRGRMAAARNALLKAKAVAAGSGLNDRLPAIECSLVRIHLGMRNPMEAKEALARAEAGPRNVARLQAMVLMARARYSHGTAAHEDAFAAAAEAAPILLQLKDYRELGFAYLYMALARSKQSRFAEADVLLEHGLKRFRQCRADDAVGVVLSLKAMLLIEQDQLDAAKPLLEAADKLLRTRASVPRIAEHDMHYAEFWRKRRDPMQERAAAERAAAGFEKAGDLATARKIRSQLPK